MLALGLGLTGCAAANEEGSTNSAATVEGASGTLNGAGSSSQEAAMAAWQAGFQTANPEVTVNYDPVGSGGGREQFIAGGVDFAGSDSYLDDEEGELSAPRSAASARTRSRSRTTSARSRSSTTSRASTTFSSPPP